MNKTCFNALCRVEAFSSLEELKTGKIRNHRQLLTILSDDENYKFLHRGRYGITATAFKKAKKNGEECIPILEKLIENYSRYYFLLFPLLPL